MRKEREVTTPPAQERALTEQEIKANDRAKKRAYAFSSMVNFLLPPIKLFAGITGHSAALIADAINSLLDICANIITYIFLHISAKPKEDDEHIYGHGKYEIVGSLLIALSMLVTGVLIVFGSCRTFYDYFREGVLPKSPELIALWVAITTVVLKLLTYFYTEQKAKETRSDALHAQAMDHISDVFSASAVVIGVIGARLIPGEGTLFEPLAAIIVGGLIIRSGIGVYRPAILKLTDSTVDPETVEEIRSVVETVPGATSPHHIMARMIGSETLSIELDIRANGLLTLYEAHDIASETEQVLLDHFGARTHVVVHMEPSHPYRHTRDFMRRRPDLCDPDSGEPLPDRE